MRKLKVYLDTSVINFLVVDDSPDYRSYTEIFFDSIVSSGVVETYISKIVIKEINDTKEIDKKNKLLNSLEKYSSIQMLDMNSKNAKEIAFLADVYIKSGIIPRKKVADAFHVAYTTVFEMDILLSWNFKHLANVNKERKILILNKTYGYNYQFRMADPLEVLNYE